MADVRSSLQNMVGSLVIQIAELQVENQELKDKLASLDTASQVKTP